MAMIRRSAQEQLELIAQCRGSGLTISEWCLREGIKPDTYYSWVDRQSKKGRIDKAATIPQVISRPVACPDIVKVTVEQPTTMVEHSHQTSSFLLDNNQQHPIATKGAVMEVTLGAVRIKVTNQVNPQLLAQTIQLIGGTLGC